MLARSKRARCAILAPQLVERFFAQQLVERILAQQLVERIYARMSGSFVAG